MSIATAVEILMPKLSDSMEEGTILTWLIEPGAHVASGEDLLEVETDKANMTVQSEASGELEILAEEGSTVPVGAVIARLGSGVATIPPASIDQGTAARAAANGRSHLDGGATDQADDRGQAARATDQADGRGQAARATPLARRIAHLHGIDLGSLRGSGLGGRITKADVRAAAGLADAARTGGAPVSGQASPPGFAPLAAPRPGAALAAAAVAAAEPAPTAPRPAEGAKGEAEIQELSRLQAVIARRMAEAKATIPHFQVQTEVRMDAAIGLRSKLKELAGEERAPSLNDLVVRAAALALRKHPRANGSYRDGRFELHERINVGIAVAAADALVVPTIFDADRKSLGEIGREAWRLAEKVRSGSIAPPELAGGTFTVSNLGMFGMTAINPVINLPQAAILGVGAARQLLMRGGDGEIEDASIMALTLSCDHRILYGAQAAQFLAAIRDLLEAPLKLAL